MNRSPLLILLIIILMSSNSWSTIINVPADSATIQGGINGSSNGDTVLVQPGTYVENIDFNGHNIVLASLFLITGDTSYISQTVIDGDSAGSVVTFMGGEDSTAIVCGFTIQNGFTYFGGGISCYWSSPIIDKNIIKGNYGNAAGGISCEWSYSIIINNTIIENHGTGGTGGIWCYDSYTHINNNIISNNYGHAITLRADSAIIANNIISNNIGHAIYCYTYSNSTISNNVLIGNFYGIYCFENNFPTIKNNTVSGNSNYGIYVRNSYPIVVNTILWGDHSGAGNEIFIESGNPSFTYCNIQDTLWPGEGNISCDPQFCEPDSGNFDLNAFSCCVGAGQNGVDIGARGIGCWNCEGYVIGDINNSGDYNGLDVTYGVSYLKGGPPPPYECVCTPGNIWYASGDVNGSCSYNGLDITYGVSYLKGIQTELFPCPDCPPVR